MRCFSEKWWPPTKTRFHGNERRNHRENQELGISIVAYSPLARNSLAKDVVCCLNWQLPNTPTIVCHIAATSKIIICQALLSCILISTPVGLMFFPFSHFNLWPYQSHPHSLDSIIVKHGWKVVNILIYCSFLPMFTNFLPWLHLFHLDFEEICWRQLRQRCRMTGEKISRAIVRRTWNVTRRQLPLGTKKCGEYINIHIHMYTHVDRFHYSIYSLNPLWLLI